MPYGIGIYDKDAIYGLNVLFNEKLDSSHHNQPMDI